MPQTDLLHDPLVERAPVRAGYKVLGGVVLYQRLGRGGMGAVYRGTHLRLRIDVAVKVMAPPAALEAEQLERYVHRFMREARIAAAINHPNLVRVIDVDSENGIRYLVMDYVDGESASDRLDRKGRLGEHEAAGICLGAAEGLAEAHRRGIVHRDVKPDNIIIDKKGHVSVTDLGLAKAYDPEEAHLPPTRLTQAQAGIGTPCYMSPEQFVAARDVGPAADVWSLGVTLYHLLTGEPPWDGTSVFDIAAKVRTTPLPDLRARRPGLSAGLCDIVSRSTEKEPAARYADCGEFADGLRAHVEAARDSLRLRLADTMAGSTRPMELTERPPTAQTLELIGKSLLDEPPPAQASEPVILAPPVPAAGREALRLKCPACGVDFASDARSGEIVCRSCGASMSVEQALRHPVDATSHAARPDESASQAEIARLGCSGRVSCVAFSPDGRLLAAGGDDSRASVWEMPGGQALRTIEASAGGIWSIAFSPDGRLLAAGCENRIGVIWEVHSGRRVATLAEGHRRAVTSVVFSPDRIHMATGGADRAAIIWDAQFGLPLKTITEHEMAVWSVTYSPDGKVLAVGCEDGTVSLWDAKDAQRVGGFDAGPDAVLSVAYSPDGTRLAVGCGQRDGGAEGSVVLWDAAEMRAQRSFKGHSAAVRSVSFSPDGHLLATGSYDGTAALWSVESGERLRVFTGHASWVRSVAFSPDGSRLASAGSDRTVRLWDVTAPAG